MMDAALAYSEIQYLQTQIEATESRLSWLRSQLKDAEIAYLSNTFSIKIGDLVLITPEYRARYEAANRTDYDKGFFQLGKAYPIYSLRCTDYGKDFDGLVEDGYMVGVDGKTLLAMRKAYLESVK